MKKEFLSKKLDIREEAKEIELICEAMKNTNRLRILRAISMIEPNSHSEIADYLQISPSSVSSHINELVDAGIIEEEKGKGLKNRNTKIPTLKFKKLEITL